MNANRKKNIAVIACVLFVFVTLASLFYIAKEENHQCTGEDCPICACIRQAEQIVKNVGTAVNYSVTAGLIFVQRSGILANRMSVRFVHYAGESKGKIRQLNKIFIGAEWV